MQESISIEPDEKYGNRITVEKYELEIKKLNDQENKMNKITLLDFYATWCTPCKIQEPIIKELKEKYGNKLIFKEVDVDQNKEFAQKYKISAIPTIIIEKDDEIIKKFVGVTSAKKIENEIDYLLKKK